MTGHTHPLRLGGLIRAGARDVSEYTGMVLALFLVQMIVAWGAWFVIARVLVTAFAGGVNLCVINDVGDIGQCSGLPPDLNV